MRRLFAIFVSIMMIACLCSCGGGEAEEPEKSSNTDSYEFMTYELSDSSFERQDSDSADDSLGYSRHSISYISTEVLYSIKIEVYTYKEYSNLTASQYADSAMDTFIGTIQDTAEQVTIDKDITMTKGTRTGDTEGMASIYGFFKYGEDKVVSVELCSISDETIDDNETQAFDDFVKSIKLK